MTRNPLPFLGFAVLASCGGPSAPTSPPAPAPSTALGPAGGSVSLLGGALRLSVPAGALPSSVEFGARSTTAVPLDPRAVGGSSYELTPAGVAFASPATLTLRYQAGSRPSGTSEAELRLHALRGGSWDSAGGSVDGGAHEVTAAIQATGTYGARWIGPSGECGAPEDRQFDFWLGAWFLTDVTQGRNTPAGTNDITRDATGCLIDEDYRSTPVGRSVSLYSRLDGQWHQTYIDSAGNRLVLVGSLLEGRRMALYGSSASRSVWEPLDGNTVRFSQEISRDGGQTWQVANDFRYTRR